MNPFQRCRPGLTTLGILFAAWAVEGRQDADSTEARFGKAARIALAAGKEAADLRLREARASVIAEARDENDRDERFARALNESTSRTPLRVALDRNVLLDNVRVTGYVAGVVTLTWPQGEIQVPLTTMSDVTRAALVGIALTKGTSRDYFEMGKLLLRAKDYEGAGRSFATAVRLEPALAPAVPDVERLKRAARLFEGTFKQVGSSLSLHWGFSAPSEARDFQALEGTFLVQPGIGLEVNAPKVALTAVKEIPFRNRVHFSTLPKETELAAHLMGIRFVKPDGGAVLIYGALATASKTFMVIRVEDDKPQELLAPTAGAVGNRMTMDFNGGRVSFQVGGRNVWSGNEGGFSDVLAVVGAAVLAKGVRTSGASVLFKEVALQGEVNPAWMAKKTAAFRDAFDSEFSKELRARKGAPAAGVPGLSVDAALSEIPSAIRDPYRAALAKLSEARKSRLPQDLERARYAVEEMTRIDAAFAPAWYFRGAVEELEGRPRAAGESYDRALALLPEFPEALCGRGRLQALSGVWPAARESADRALALKPDLAEAHLLRARLLWELREASLVIEATQTARKLAPSDPDIESGAQQLANVARGPRWARPNVHESAHYAVRSDLPTAKCRAYAEHLEALRSHYEEVLGRPLPAGKRADVLIFESEEGYFVYSDYTVGSRQEHTLGAYSPWHSQIALFEGVDAQETFRVLAHEGFHQVLHSIAQDVPIWFNEGMAEYVGAARVEKGAIVERGGIQSGRFDALTSAVKYGWSPLPFQVIMQESQTDFYGREVRLKYAQAWSMIRYFMDGEGGRWKPVLKDYVGRLLGGEPGRAAFEATFGKQDLKEMETGWLRHYGLTPKRRLAKEAPAAAAAEPPTDLMALLAGAGANATGSWSFTDGVLQSSHLRPSSLDLGLVPPAEYDWRLTVQRIMGRGPLILGLQGGASTFILRLDDAGTSRIEAVDGLDPANSRPVRPRVVLPPGKTVSLLCSVRTSGVTITADAEVMLDWKGEFRRLTYIPGPEMPPPTKSLFLHSKEVTFQITAMSIATVGSEGGPAATSKAPVPENKIEGARSIALGSELRCWLSDEEGRQILALDSAGTLLQISTSELKSLRKIAVGNGASCLSMAPANPKSVWVGNLLGTSLIRVDLEKGEIAETIPTPYPAEGLAVIRKVAYCLVPRGGICAVDLADKKDLGNLGPDYFTAIAYDARKDRLWGLSHGFLVEFEGSKSGTVLKEMSRKSAKERTDLIGVVNGLGKKHSIGGLDNGQLGPRLYFDERSSRLYVSAVVVRAEKPETSLGAYRAPPHSLEKDPVVHGFLVNILGRDQILAASADGKWAASGTHLFNTATFSVRQELPLPTSMVAFSKDSKELYYYDWVNKSIAVLDIEGK